MLEAAAVTSFTFSLLEGITHTSGLLAIGFSTRSTRTLISVASTAFTESSAASILFYLAAVFASGRFILKFFLGIEFLFTNGKYEACLAILQETKSNKAKTIIMKHKKGKVPCK